MALTLHTIKPKCLSPDLQASLGSCLCPPNSWAPLSYPGSPFTRQLFLSNLKYTTFSAAIVLFHLLSSSVWNVLFLISVLGSFLSRFMSQLKYCLLQETFCAHNLVRILHGADTVTLLFILFLLLITSRKHHMCLLHLHH